MLILGGKSCVFLQFVYLSEDRVKYVQMRVQINAVGVLQALHLVALSLLVEHIQLDLDVGNILCGLAQVVDHWQ